MDKRKAIISCSVAILLAAAGAWGFGLFGGTDPAVAKLQQLSDQMSDKNLSPAQVDQLRGEFRQQLPTLTDDQRHAYFEANRDKWMARSQEQMGEFFAMSKADQQKRLDEIIGRMTQPRDNQRQNNSGRGQSTNNGRDGRGNMTEAQREERSKRRLDSTSPKMRAQYTEFRRMLDKRAEERGVKIENPWGRGPGSGPRGA